MRERRLQALRRARADDDRCAPVEAGAVPRRGKRPIHARVQVQGQRRLDHGSRPRFQPHRPIATVLLRLQNKESDGLGKPLPAGVVSVMNGSPGAMLAGQDKIENRQGPARRSVARTAMDIWIEPRVTEEKTIEHRRPRRGARHHRGQARQRQARTDHSRVSPASARARTSASCARPARTRSSMATPSGLSDCRRANAPSCVTLCRFRVST